MEDYQDAANRHLDDAQLLFAHSSPRLANASHLFGISAECSLKAMARKFNPSAKFIGNKGHLPLLFSELSNVASALAGNAVLASQIAEVSRYFSSWEVSQRYESQSTFVASVVLLEQKGASDAHLLMTNCLSGLI